jgi:periplasmic protein TonB
LRVDLRRFYRRHWPLAASLLLHAAAGAVAVIVLPTLIKPVSHSDDSERAIAVEIAQLPPPAPPSPAPQSVPERAKAEPVLRSPKSQSALPPPAPKKAVVAPKPKVAELPPHNPDPLMNQASPFNMQMPIVGDSHDQVASLPSGLAGPPPDYLTKIRLQLERNKVYPRIAQMRREEGVVVLSFVIDRGGHVLKHAIDRSSGYSVLDQEAEAILTRAEPLPPIPPEMTGGTLEIVVPLQFELSDPSRH